MKPEHVKPPPPVEEKMVEEKIVEEQIEPADVPHVVELPKQKEELVHTTPQGVYDKPIPERPDIYPQRIKRPNSLLEPSSYPQVMDKTVA